MHLIPVTKDFSVAFDVTAEDAAALADRGFAKGIHVLPDADTAGLTASEKMRASVEGAGMAFAHVPVVVGLITPKDIEAFAANLENAAGTVVAICHSGLRAVLMWALAKLDQLGEAVVLDLASCAGYDIAPYLGEDSEALLAA